MPYVYSDQLATPGTLTTNASGNTETETAFLKPGSTRSLYLAFVQVAGKQAAATTLNAITLRTFKWGTASTGGTSLSSIAKDASSPSTTITSGSRPTSGTTRTNAGPIVSCGTTTKDLWQSNDPDHMTSLAAGNAGSISFMDTGASASLVFEPSFEHREY